MPLATNFHVQLLELQHSSVPKSQGITHHKIHKESTEAPCRRAGHAVGQGVKLPTNGGCGWGLSMKPTETLELRPWRNLWSCETLILDIDMCLSCVLILSPTYLQPQQWCASLRSSLATCTCIMATNGWACSMCTRLLRGFLHYVFWECFHMFCHLLWQVRHSMFTLNNQLQFVLILQASPCFGFARLRGWGDWTVSPRMRETSALICVRTFQTQRFLLSTGKISRSGFFQIAQRSVSFEIGWKKIHASAIDTHENCQHLNRCNIQKSGKSNAVQEPYSFNFQKCKLPGASNWQILPNPDISLTADDFSTFFCQKLTLEDRQMNSWCPW